MSTENNEPIYREILEKLTPLLKETPEHSANMYIFLAASETDGDVGLKIAMAGNTPGWVRAMLMAITKGAPQGFLHAMILTVANMLASNETDENARILGTALGLWAEEYFGTIECDCPECTQRRRDNLKDINVN